MVEMKKVWSRPLTVVQNFEANEYVAACGDKGTVYKFECNAGGGAKGDVFTSDGTNLTEDRFLNERYYYACNKKHEADKTDDFINGTFYYNDGNDRTTDWFGTPYESIPVIIWTEGGTNVHCTTALDMSTWETSKS